MLVTLLWMAGVGQGLGEVPRLPKPVPMRVLAPERWTIERLAKPLREDGDFHRPRKVQVGGRTVTISPTAEFESLDGVRKGADGSLLIERSHQGINWSSQDSIWFKGKETPVRYGSVTIYVDRLNYAGSIVRDQAATGMPMSPPEGFVVQKGKWRSLGFGEVNYWSSDGTFVLTTPVNAEGKPASPEETESFVVRVISPGHSVAFPGFDFVGWDAEGAAVLKAGGQILRYRAGKVIGLYDLPDRWRAAGMSPSGWLLLRRESARQRDAMPDLPKDPEKMKEWSDQMSKWEDDDLAAMTESERDWSAAVAVGGTMAPLQFTRPPKTEHLLWRTEYGTLGKDALRFDAFLGAESQSFRLAAPAKSLVRR